jgi:hypothetical protein
MEVSMNMRSTGKASSRVHSSLRRFRSCAQLLLLALGLLGMGADAALPQAANAISADELRARLNELQNQVLQLQGKLPPLQPNAFFGGQVHGFVVAGVGDFAKFEGLMFLPDAQVYLRNHTTGVPGPKVATNDQGYFVTPNTVSGQYDVCVEAAGFGSTCDGTPVFITRGTVVLNHNLMIRPSGGFVTGRVLLKDGTPCFQENSMFQTYVYGKLELLDASNKLVAPAVRTNSYGYYVLPTGAASGTLQLHAACDNGRASRSLTLVGPGAATQADLTIPASTPQILSLIPTAAGHMVRTAGPGDTLQVAANAVDFNGMPLGYRWADPSGAAVTGSGPSVNWKLAPQGQMEMLYVEVTNGNGGYLRKHVTLRTGDRSSLMSGTVIDSFTGGPLAGAIVTVNGKVLQSQADGTFITSVPEAQRYVINARKSGYGLQSRIVYLPTSGLTITLDRTRRQVCMPNAACNITAEGRTTLTRLQVPAGALVDENGHAPTGPVNLDVIGYDTTKPNPIPGDFAAKTKNGGGVALLTYGAASIDATDANGHHYTLAPGKTAHLAMRVDAAHVNPAPPATVPLWEYSEATGLWTERATATYNPATRSYEGDIPGFSAWNADATFSNTACINITVPDAGGPPLPFILHALPTPQNNFQHTVFTVTDSTFPIYRLYPNTDVDIEIHANVTPDPGAIATFHLNSGNASNPQPPPDGVPVNPATDCNGIDKATGKAPVLLLNVSQTYLSLFGPAPSATETDSYLQSVGALDSNKQPTSARGTFKAWKTTNGLSVDPKNPVPGEVVAVYFNNGDLQLGRDMHCLTQGTKTACYVTNYGSLQGDAQAAIHDALNKNNPVATVAMEYDPALGTAGVRFYAFKANDDLFPNPVLDSQGGKFLPQNCMACHGGSYDQANHNADNSSFLPFDINTFVFDLTAGSSAGPGAQDDKFRQLNAIVRGTSPNNINVNNPITGLIDGWYAACGGVNNTTNCNSVDNAYAPQGWQNQGSTSSASSAIVQLYQTIPRVYCRTCHIAQGSATTGFPDWTQYSDFNSPGFVGGAVCQQRNMPHAEVPFKKFWFSNNPYAPTFLSSPTPNGIGVTPCNPS